MLHRHWQCFFALMLLVGVFGCILLPNVANAADLTTPVVSQDGRMALIPIDPDNITAIKELLPQVQNQIHGVTVAVYTPVGLLPQVLIIGESSAVTQAAKMIKEMFIPTGDKHMVVISANLRQLTDSDTRQLGLNLMPSNITYSASYTGTIDKTTSDGRNLTQSGTFTANVNDGSSANILQMTAGDSLGKILVASEVFTPNGVKTQISDVQHVPVFSVDSNNNVQTDYQDLETSIAVTPTVMTIDTSNPLAATVRLDISVKVNIISGSSTMGSATAPQYAEKQFTTTRVFPADGRTYIVGTFVSDSDIKSRTGVPFLMKIPLLKYLFSQESVQKSRSYAVLTLSVKVLPSGTMPQQMTVPWFEPIKQGHSSKADKQNTDPHSNIPQPDEKLKKKPTLLTPGKI
ncbi:MAG TPA: hypothetical protein VN611_02140 [Patescibacteria group bacterium]|nr:hypothetical protein [Patescibacteria group bacterium]